MSHNCEKCKRHSKRLIDTSIVSVHEGGKLRKESICMTCLAEELLSHLEAVKEERKEEIEYLKGNWRFH